MHKTLKKHFVKNKKVIFLAGAVLVLVFLFTQTSILKFPAGPKKLETVQVERKNFRETVTASGTIESEQKAILRFPTTGKVSWVGVKEGDSVFMGHALAKLDTVKLNSDYQRALSDLRAAQATLERVYDEVKDHQTDETFKQKETRTTAEVAKDKAYEAVLKAEKDLKEAMLVAPFSGIIAEISEGLVAGANTSLSDQITIINPTNINFTALVDEIDFRKMKTGQEAIVKLDAFPKEEFNGKVISIGKTTQISTTGAVVVLAKIVLAQDSRFIIGLSGEAEFIIGEK